MSYILDALKKAEAERTLGSVPTLHAQPVHASMSDYTSPLLSKPWVWIALAASAALIVALAWRRPWQTPPVPPAVPALAQAAAPVDTPAITEEPEAVTPLPRKESANKPLKPAGMQASAPSEQAPEPSPASHQKLALATSITLSAVEEPVAKLSELPEQIQREIPQITMGGYIYSSDPAGRSVLINNKLMHEGDQVTPSLMLEKMMPNGLILNYKGYRYRLGY